MKLKFLFLREASLARGSLYIKAKTKRKDGQEETNKALWNKNTTAKSERQILKGMSRKLKRFKCESEHPTCFLAKAGRGVIIYAHEEFSLPQAGSVRSQTWLDGPALKPASRPVKTGRGDKTRAANFTFFSSSSLPGWVWKTEAIPAVNKHETIVMKKYFSR